MPLRSMTGYGVASRACAGGADGSAAGWSLEVEARSVNSRYREVKIRQPFGARAEQLIRKAVEARVGRGRIDVAVQMRRDATEDAGLAALGVDPDALAGVAAALAEVRRIAGEKSLEVRDPSPAELLRFATGPRAGAEGRPEVPAELESTVDEALAALVRLREKEGAELAAALGALADDLGAAVARLDPLLAGEPARLAAAVQERLTSIVERTGLTPPDGERLEQEVATLLLRGDVTEERVRIDAHLRRVRDVLSAPAAKGQGKTLDFLCQELFREITTIGSKISNHEGSAIVIDAKAIVERLREQVQNVE